MIPFDMRGTDASAERELVEIEGAERTESSVCTLSRDRGALRVAVEGSDANMLDLISSISPDGKGRFLYEEDCIQVALALAGESDCAGSLLVNPHGTRSETGDAPDWPTRTHRGADGWSIEVRLPVPESAECVGLSVHRFYRGVHGEVQGLTRQLPHPLEPAKFMPVVVAGSGEADEMAQTYLESARGAAETALEQQLEEARDRIQQAHGGLVSRPAHNCSAFGTDPSLQRAIDMARERAKQDLRPHPGFLCWNEAYFQHALVDLWELTGERSWLETAVDRAERVWDLRADQRGLVDSLRKRCLPTWYGDSTDATACTLVSGVISMPIARMMRRLRDAGTEGELLQRTEPWIERLREVVELHDPEWVDWPDGSGMHLEPYQKGPRCVYPRGGSRINPLNREYALGIPMLHLARVTGEEEYRRKVRRMARYFRETSEVTEDRFVWEYLVGRYPAEGEDLSHAHCQVLFAELCCREEIVLTEADLRKIAGTLARNVFRHGDVPCNTIRGHQPGLHPAVAAWSSLTRFVPEVLPRIENVATTLLRENANTFNGQGWGIRLLTCLERARRGLPAGV